MWPLIIIIGGCRMVGIWLDIMAGFINGGSGVNPEDGRFLGTCEGGGGPQVADRKENGIHEGSASGGVGGGVEEG